MSVMMESVMNPDLESTAPNAMSQRNFFIIGSGYMLLQARYGYHFCTVESQAGPDGYENFVSFQFKGGRADASGGGCARPCWRICWRGAAFVRT